jgi:hypothetical protein
LAFAVSENTEKGLGLAHDEGRGGPSVYCADVPCPYVIWSGDSFSEAIVARCCLENIRILAARGSLSTERPEAYVLDFSNQLDDLKYITSKQEARLRLNKLVGFVGGKPLSFCQQRRMRLEDNPIIVIRDIERLLEEHLDGVVRFLELFSSASEFIKEAWRQLKWNPKARRNYIVVGTCLPIRTPLPSGVPEEISRAFKNFDFSFDIWLSMLTEANVGELLVVFHLCLFGLYLEIKRYFENRVMPKLPDIDFEVAGPDFRSLEVFLKANFTPMSDETEANNATGAVDGTHFEWVIPDYSVLG